MSATTKNHLDTKTSQRQHPTTTKKTMKKTKTKPKTNYEHKFQNDK